MYINQQRAHDKGNQHDQTQVPIRINKKLTNFFWKARRGTSNAQITQTLESQYAKYMKNHKKKHNIRNI